MRRRTIPMFAAAIAASILATAPLMAQAPLPHSAEDWDGRWEDGRDDEVTWSTDTGRHSAGEAPRPAPAAEYAPSYREGLADGGRAERLHHHPHRHIEAGNLREAQAQFGYSPYERAAWLEDCRTVMLGSGRAPTANGGEARGIGGIVGAIAGGLIGNRAAGGARIGGTMLGAGAGGIAGLLIGGAIDAAGRRERIADADTAYRECEDYLARYERDWAHSTGEYRADSAQYAAHGPVAMVPITTTYRYAPVRMRIVEIRGAEEVADTAPSPATQRRAPIKRVRIER